MDARKWQAKDKPRMNLDLAWKFFASLKAQWDVVLKRVAKKIDKRIIQPMSLATKFEFYTKCWAPLMWYCSSCWVP